MRKKNKRYMKLYSILLTAGLVFSLSGCGNGNEVENSTEATVQTVTEAEVEEKAEEQTKEDMDENDQEEISSDDDGESTEDADFMYMLS